MIFFPPYPNAYTLPAGSTAGVFSADADQCGSGTTLLSTATFAAPVDASGVTALTLTFLSDWNAIDTADSCFVEASTNGTTWDRLLTYGSVDVRNTTVVLDLGAYDGSPALWVRFVSIQPGWDWWWTIDNVLLEGVIPVELTSFTANVISGNVNLNWQTATETNNYGFDIERRTEGQEFIKVGFVAGYGTTTETKSYTFVDNSVTSGSYTYRLKQVDLDGTFEYSNEVEVSLVPAAYSLAQNYPNPFNPSTKIDFSLASDSKVTLKIFDVLGQEVITLINGNLSAGLHSQNFDAASLNSGVYFYTIEATGSDGTNFTSTKKMILTK
ncbi:MAG: hypothetical protein A2V93_05855 [Ignavibacteria bacterium RBG_16_34_14]|nr:MAG: hypothetical protein A2V93_05855 [Ignavibacteria bacterium RBG_16_34_14]